MLVNPATNPFTSELIRRTWEIFKELGGTSPAKDPDLWRKAFEEARSELGSRAFKGWYENPEENPIWVKVSRGRLAGREYVRVVPSEVKEIERKLGLDHYVPIYRLRTMYPDVYRRFLREKERLISAFKSAYPSYEAWVRAGKPRMPTAGATATAEIPYATPEMYEELHVPAGNPGGEILLNPFAKGFIEDVWEEFKKLGGRSPALDPDLWRKAFDIVRARWGKKAFRGWYENPEVLANPGFLEFRSSFIDKIAPYLEGQSVMDVVKMTAAGLAGFWFANYIPKVTKWETGWQGVVASVAGALIAGYLAHSIGRVGLPAFLGGMLNVGAKVLKMVSGGKITVISGVEDIEDIGEEEEEEVPEIFGEEEPEEEELEVLGVEEEEEKPKEAKSLIL